MHKIVSSTPEEKARIEKLLRQFQLKFSDFEINGKFNTYVNTIYVLSVEEGDFFGRFYILEMDFIQSIDNAKAELNEEIGSFEEFIKVKRPIDKFEETRPFKAAKVYKKPNAKAWMILKEYATDKYTSSGASFAFLVRK